MVAGISELLLVFVSYLIGGSEANSGWFHNEVDSGKCITNFTQIIPSKSRLGCMLSCLNETDSCAVLSYSETENMCRIATVWEISEDCGNNVAAKLNVTVADSGSTSYSSQIAIDGVAALATFSDGWCCDCTSWNPCYLTLDLGTVHTVEYIVLWSRPDGAGSYKFQVSNMEFRISTTMESLESPSSLCFYRPGTPDVQQETLYCNTEKLGRYVKATRLDTTGQILCFVELEVYGYESGYEYTNNVEWSVV